MCKSLHSSKDALMINVVSISTSTLSRIKEEGDDFDKKTTRLKPLLTPKHEYDCFELCKSKLDENQPSLMKNIIFQC